MLSQVVKAGPWIVVWLQVHRWDVACLTLEPKRRFILQNDLSLSLSLIHIHAFCFISIPDKPPAVVRLPQHLDHRADGHRNFIFFFSAVALHSTVKDTWKTQEARLMSLQQTIYLVYD